MRGRETATVHERCSSSHHPCARVRMEQRWIHSLGVGASRESVYQINNGAIEVSIDEKSKGYVTAIRKEAEGKTFSTQARCS